MKFLHPQNWPRAKGYSNGISAQGETIFVAGQIGWDAQQKMVGEELVAQVGQALRNIITVLSEANAKPENIVRLTWFVTDIAEYRRQMKQVGEIYREVMGSHYPTMSLLQVTSLVEPAAKVEIEATAVIEK